MIRRRSRRGGVRRSAPCPTAPTRGYCAPCCWRAGPFGGAWDHWTERGVTARSLDHIWSLPADILARLEHGVGRDAKPLALLDETVALRRCALYRDGFKGTAVGYHAKVAWIRRAGGVDSALTGVTVDVTVPSRPLPGPGSGDRPDAHGHAFGGCGVDPARGQRRSGKVCGRLQPADREPSAAQRRAGSSTSSSTQPTTQAARWRPPPHPPRTRPHRAALQP